MKAVPRIPGNTPSLKSYINLFDLYSGDLLSVIESNWITAMRTGAVAALAAKTFAVDYMESPSFGVVGIGSTARATIMCLSSHLGCDIRNVRKNIENIGLHISKHRYNNQIMFNI